MSHPYEPVEDSTVARHSHKFNQQALANRASWAVNWSLLIVKLIITIVSSSKAVTAALIDSAVDLLSQGLLSTAGHKQRKYSENYPIGRSRLEALSVLACAAVMIFASVEVVQFSIVDLYNGLYLGKISYINTTLLMFALLGGCTIAKGILYLYCIYINRSINSDTISALSEDHLNDVISNLMAVATAAVAGFAPKYWWMDPVGAILISGVIIYRWVDVITDQCKKIVGYTAPPEFIEDLNELAEKHDGRIQVDVTRAYYFGSAYNCEMEIILPAEMTVRESHDIALALQHKIEMNHDIERAFVHVDYQARDGLEHKIERNLQNSSSGNNSPSSRANRSYYNLDGVGEQDFDTDNVQQHYQDRFV